MMGDRIAPETAVAAIIFLFFFQLIADFVEAIYAFGLLGTSIPPEIASVLFLFAPALLLVWRKGVRERPLRALSLVIILSRLIEVMLDTRGRMLLSGVGVAAFLIWLPALLHNLAQHANDKTASLTTGLMGGTALSVLLRVWGSGSDISTVGGWQALGWVLGLAALVLLFQRCEETAVSPRPEAKAKFGRLVGLVIGLNSAVILLYFAFTSPNVIARWTGASYPTIIVTMAVAVGLFVGLLAFRPQWLAGMKNTWLAVWNGLFVLSLTATVLGHQIQFPAAPGAYPLYETAASPFYSFTLYLTLLLFPIIFVDFGLYARAIVSGRPSLRQLGGAFTIAGLFLLIMIFAHVFTTVYDYIPVVGPFFRDKFWLVYLVAGLGLSLPLTFNMPMQFVLPASSSWKIVWVGAVSFAVFAVSVTVARPPEPVAGTAVRVLTYNIQQGYDGAGQQNYRGQLNLIRGLDADIIGLQESDNNRIAGGNGDLVRLFADALDMHSYYGPKTVPGTFGIALLSKYPIENPRTFYMFSEGEQTATIEAEFSIGGQTYTVFVTHLGNGGPIVQQEAILEAAAGRENVILMGDFNFRPDGEQYALTTAVFNDAWLLKWPDGINNAGVNPADRIDHIFVSPGIQVQDVAYIFSPASDHPAETAVLTH